MVRYLYKFQDVSNAVLKCDSTQHGSLCLLKQHRETADTGTGPKQPESALHFLRDSNEPDDKPPGVPVSHIPVFHTRAQHLTIEHDRAEMTLGRAGFHGITLFQPGLLRLLCMDWTCWSWWLVIHTPNSGEGQVRWKTLKKRHMSNDRIAESSGGILNRFLPSSAVCLNSLNDKSPQCHLIRENK